MSEREDESCEKKESGGVPSPPDVSSCRTKNVLDEDPKATVKENIDNEVEGETMREHDQKPGEELGPDTCNVDSIKEEGATGQTTGSSNPEPTKKDATGESETTKSEKSSITRKSSTMYLDSLMEIIIEESMKDQPSLSPVSPPPEGRETQDKVIKDRTKEEVGCSKDGTDSYPDVSLVTPVLQIDSSPESDANQAEGVTNDKEKLTETNEDTSSKSLKNSASEKSIFSPLEQKPETEMANTDDQQQVVDMKQPIVVEDDEKTEVNSSLMKSQNCDDDLKKKVEVRDERHGAPGGADSKLPSLPLDERLVSKQPTGKLDGAPASSVLRDILLLSYKKAAAVSASQDKTTKPRAVEESLASNQEPDARPKDANNNVSSLPETTTTPTSGPPSIASVESAAVSKSFQLYPPIFAEMKQFVEESKGKIVHDKLFNEITADDKLSERPGINDIGTSIKSVADLYEILSRANLPSEEVWTAATNIIHTLADSLCDANWRESLNNWHQTLAILKRNSIQNTLPPPEQSTFLVPVVSDDEDRSKNAGVLHLIPDQDITLVEKLFYLRHMDVHTQVHNALTRSVTDLDLCEKCIHENPLVRDRLDSLLQKIAISFTMRYADEKLSKSSHLGKPFEMSKTLQEGVREATWQIYWQITAKYPCLCVVDSSRKGSRRRSRRCSALPGGTMSSPFVLAQQRGTLMQMQNFNQAPFPNIHQPVIRHPIMNRPGNPFLVSGQIAKPRLWHDQRYQSPNTKQTLYPTIASMLNNQAKASTGLIHEAAHSNLPGGGPYQRFPRDSAEYYPKGNLVGTRSVVAPRSSPRAAAAGHRQDLRFQHYSGERNANQPSPLNSGTDINNQIAFAIERLERNVATDIGWKSGAKGAEQSDQQPLNYSESTLKNSFQKSFEGYLQANNKPAHNTNAGQKSRLLPNDQTAQFQGEAKPNGGIQQPKSTQDGNNNYQASKPDSELDEDDIFSPNFKPLDVRELKEMAELPQILPRQSSQEATDDDPFGLFPLYRSLSYPSVKVKPSSAQTNDINLFNSKKTSLQASNLLTASTASQTSILSEVSTILSLDGDVSSEDRYPVNLSMRAMTSNEDQFQGSWHPNQELIQTDLVSQSSSLGTLAPLDMYATGESDPQPISLTVQPRRSSFQSRQLSGKPSAPHVHFSMEETQTYQEPLAINSYSRIEQTMEGEMWAGAQGASEQLPLEQLLVCDRSTRGPSVLQKTMQTARVQPVDTTPVFPPSAPTLQSTPYSDPHRSILKRKSNHVEEQINYQKRNRLEKTPPVTSTMAAQSPYLVSRSGNAWRADLGTVNSSRPTAVPSWEFQLQEEPQDLSPETVDVQRPSPQTEYTDFFSSDVLWDELKERGYKICDCGLVSKDRTLFYIHYGSHSHDGLFSCSFCGFANKRGDACFSHLVDVHTAL